MDVTRSISVVFGMIAVVTSVGGAQASGTKPAAAAAPSSQQM